MIQSPVSKLAQAAAISVLLCASGALAQQNINPNQQPKAQLPQQKAQPKNDDSKIVNYTFTTVGGGRLRVAGSFICQSGPLSATNPADVGKSKSCGFKHAKGVPLTVVAEPLPGWEFSHWSRLSATNPDAFCSVETRPECQIAKTGPDTIMAFFAPAKAKAIIKKSTVDVQISGAGKVTTLPFAGDPVNCEQKGTQAASGDCKTSVTANTSITLQATPAPGFEFTGWKVAGNANACQNKTPSCVFTAPQATTVSATFAPIEAYLTPDQWPKTISTNGKPALFKGKLTNKNGGAALANIAIELKFDNKWGCKATTSAAGQFGCSISLDASAANLIGTQKDISATALVSAHKISIQADKRVLVVNDKGWIERKVAPKLFMSILENGIPGGVLLNNYLGGFTTPKQSHQKNGSRLFQTKSLDPNTAKKFDIAVASNSPFYYFINNVFVRTGTPTLKQPAVVSIPLAVTGFDGHGPSIKGHCYDSSLCVLGYDKTAPDVTNIALNGGLVEIALSVNASGQITTTIQALQGSVDFDCGGVASALCGTAKNFVNGEMQAKMKELVGSQLLADQINAGLKQQLKNLGIGQLGQIEFATDGTLILWGIPAGV